MREIKINLKIKFWSNQVGVFYNFFFSTGKKQEKSKNNFRVYLFKKIFQFFYICYGWLIITIIFVKFILNSSLGISLRASKENEDRVRSVGINPKKVKLISFIISGAITGLAGSLYADLNRFVSPTILSWQMSGEIMILVILGGMLRLYGPILGAFFYIILEQFLGGITENWQFWLGFIILLEVLYAKAGIMSFLIRDKYNEKTSS